MKYIYLLRDAAGWMVLSMWSSFCSSYMCSSSSIRSFLLSTSSPSLILFLHLHSSSSPPPLSAAADVLTLHVWTNRVTADQIKTPD